MSCSLMKHQIFKGYTKLKIVLYLQYKKKIHIEIRSFFVFQNISKATNIFQLFKKLIFYVQKNWFLWISNYFSQKSYDVLLN